MNDLRNSFPNQEPDEVVYILTRPHPVSYFGELLVYLFVVGTSTVCQFIVYYQFSGPIPGLAISLLGFFNMLATLVYFVAVIDNYYDITIVTNDRLVDIDQEQLFYRKISELVLTDVQDVSTTVKGFLPTLFNYGDVFIQTASEKANFQMPRVSYPREIASIITDLSDQAERKIKRSMRRPTKNIVGIIDGQIINKNVAPKKKGLVTLSEYNRLLGRQRNSNETV